MRFMYGCVSSFRYMISVSFFLSTNAVLLCFLQLFREAKSSVLEIMKVDVVSFIYIPIQVWNLMKRIHLNQYS